MIGNGAILLESQKQALVDAWRILDGLGCVDQIFNHISVVVEGVGGELQLIMNPADRLPQELLTKHLFVSLLRQWTAAEIVGLNVNPDGWNLHSRMHRSRMRPGVVIHTHSLYCTAVSCSKQGLLPLTQTAMEFCDDLLVVDYDGVFRSQSLSDELERLARSGGSALLRNHGALVVADTVPEALYLAYYLEEACKLQVVALSQGVPMTLPAPRASGEAARMLKQERASIAELLFEALRRTCVARR